MPRRMCGIAGILDPNGGPVRQDWLAAMAGQLAHRGPDGEGFHTEPGLGFAHRRLAVVDLVTGDQPMASADETLWVVFNGEIFNYVELREALLARGHRFRTTSDTEVLLAMYAEHGERMLPALNGQFAFALWDRPRRRLLLGRDRFGERPLHWCTSGGAFAFASELKGLLAWPPAPRALDPQALAETLTFWAPLAPRTPFAGIAQVPPGGLVSIEAGKVEQRKWFELEAIWQRGNELPAARAREELHARLQRSVALRMRADVPVGSYVSGGVDSSVVTALAQRQAGAQLRTFSIRFADPAFDERDAQQQLVDALGLAGTWTAHESSEPPPFPTVVRHAEQTLLRTAPGPMLALAGSVRAQRCKVVLTGEGADEFLGGYDLFLEQKLRRFAARAPGSPRRRELLQRLYSYLPQLQAQPAAMREAFFAAQPDELSDPFFAHRTRWRNGAALCALLLAEPPAHDPVQELQARLPSGFDSWDPLSRAQHLEAWILLPGYLLSAQGDRMAMAHGVEARFPYLDPDVVTFAAALPPRQRLHGATGKWLLRELARELLPEALAARAKHPYRAPDLASFFAPDGRPRADWVLDMLSPQAIMRAGLFAPAAVARLVQKIRSRPDPGTRDTMALVAVLSTQLLHAQLVAGEAIA